MKLMLVLLLLLLIGCTTSTPRPDDASIIFCVDPRPTLCAPLQDQVCGTDGRTYRNACEACTNPSVAGYAEGPC